MRVDKLKGNKFVMCKTKIWVKYLYDMAAYLIWWHLLLSLSLSMPWKAIANARKQLYCEMSLFKNGLICLDKQQLKSFTHNAQIFRLLLKISVCERHQLRLCHFSEASHWEAYNAQNFASFSWDCHGIGRKTMPSKRIITCYSDLFQHVNWIKNFVSKNLIHLKSRVKRVR